MVLLIGLLLGSCSKGCAQTPLPATLPAYEPPPRKSLFTAPAEAGAAAVTEGLVVDESGRPIPGVFCLIRGSRLAVETGPDGRYRLPVPARYLSRRGVVRVRLASIGFMGQQVRLDARLAEQPVVRLVPDTRPLH